MTSKKTLFLQLLSLCAFLLIHTQNISMVNAQVAAPNALKPSSQVELNLIYEKASKQAAQNLNRYAIEQLKEYDQLIDALSTVQLNDSIKSLEKQYKLSTGGRSEELSKNRLSIDELTKAKFTNQNRYDKLLRKAGITFAVWFIIVLILLQVRKRHLRNQSLILQDSSSKLNAMLQRSELGKKLIQTNTKFKKTLEKINNSTATLMGQMESISEKAISHDDIEKTKTNLELSKSLHSGVTLETDISRFISGLEAEPSTELQTVDINSICNTAMEIASRGAQYNISADALVVSKDLEKNLPKISVVPERIYALLLNILNNSFQSVKLKYEEGIKGYQPKVIISTRILPRFLQIRIRDNGNGIPKDLLEKVKDEFYSLQPVEGNTGLGLPDTIKLLGEPHKGELRLESDPTEGADIYIKFYLS